MEHLSLSPNIPLTVPDLAPVPDIDMPTRRPLVHLIRHGQALHNIDNRHPLPDPALTVHGEEVAYTINLGGAVVPDLIIISPMTRAIQTAINAFSGLIMEVPQKVEVQIWPELREAHDAPCNKGVSRAEISRKFPQFDFSSCPKEWDHVPHSTEAAIARAEIVRQRLNTLSETYNNIAVICHRGFLAFLVQGERFALGERRSYWFADNDEAEEKRMGKHCETEKSQDFGPTVLLPYLD